MKDFLPGKMDEGESKSGLYREVSAYHSEW
jgi:hypothetical protein